METLVSTASYEPVARVSWKRAVTLLFDGKVEVIEEYEDRFIRSITLEIKMPSVIRFLRAVRARKQMPKFSRENVYARDNGRCQYCAKKVMRQRRPTITSCRARSAARRRGRTSSSAAFPATSERPARRAANLAPRSQPAQAQSSTTPS